MQIGIMQGRLLPFFKKNYQAHPIGSWQKEFFIANDLGLNSIEFILDSYFYKDNPLINNEGLSEIKSLINKTGINVSSVCADIFMDWPIQNIVDSEKDLYISIINKLIESLSIIGGRDIIIPFVDNSKIKNEKEKIFIIDFLNKFEKKALQNDINICIESDLKPSELNKFIREFDNEKIKINYDSGNSASLGYKFIDELALYQDKIQNIHIKDRKINGKSILLGNGNAELKEVKKFIYSDKFNGTVTFQAYRDENQIETFKKQLDYFNSL